MIATPFGKAILLARRLGLSFLARFDFPGAWSNVLVSPRTAQPGPGTLVITDTNNKLSIVGGKLTFATGGVTAGDPGAWGTQLARVAGRTVVSGITISANGIAAGWDSAQTAGISDAIALLASGSTVRSNGTGIDGGLTISNATLYQVAVVQRVNGFFGFIKGGIYTNWTLVWVGIASTADFYPACGSFGGTTAVGTLDNFRVIDLAAPFSTDYGLATQRLAGAQSAGQTFTHEANCVIEYVQTTISSTATLLDFRQQDANNLWRININATGDITVSEVVAGTPTNRIFVSAVVANGHRIVIVADGTTIRVYSNNVLRGTYASASNFATATAGGVFALGTGGAVSEIISWPRILSGAIATLLDDAANGIGTFLLNDEFTTTEGGAIPSPYTEGNGSLTITDTNAKMSIASGKLTFATGGVAAMNPGVWSQSLARATGRTVIGIFNKSAQGIDVGFDTDQSGALNEYMRLDSSNTILILNNIATGLGLSNATDYKVALVLRLSGSFYFIKGGAFADWLLVYVTFGITSTPVFAGTGAQNTTSAATVDNFRVLDLAAPFNDSYGLATQRLAGAQSAGQVFTHEANCIIEYVQTTVPSSSPATDVFIRMQDANNAWVVSTTSAGNLVLGEFIGGVYTQRATAAAVVSSGHRIVVVADGTTIRGYSNNVLRWTYASASNFATATAGKLSALGTGGAISDIISWPRVLPAAAAALLDAAVA